jgi:hypothetical protein
MMRNAMPCRGAYFCNMLIFKYLKYGLNCALGSAIVQNGVQYGASEHPG